MIEFNNVSKIYYSDIEKARKRAFIDTFWQSNFIVQSEKNIYALLDISFSLKEKESLIVLGPPKSGKTTIAKLICGLAQPSIGEVNIRGSTRLVNSARIGATPFMTIKNYLSLLSMLYGAKNKSLPYICKNILEICDLESYADVRIAEFPNELLKKLIYYTSIYIDSDIYIFDESFKNDNSEFGQMCNARIDEIIKTSTVVILSSKEINIPANNISKMMILNEGCLLHFGNYESVLPLYHKLNLLPQPFRSDEEKKEFKQSKVNKKTRHKDELIDLSSFETNYKTMMQNRLNSPNLIIAGPYMADTGMEIIYWIPYLRWLIENYHLDRNNFIALSRCGAEIWYRELGLRYIDICDLLSEQEFIEMHNKRISKGKIKQFSISDEEKRLLSIVLEKLAIKDYNLIHPSFLFELLSVFWMNTSPIEFINNFVNVKPTELFVKNLSGMPDNYIAVNFSFCPCFPDTLKNRQFMKELLSELSKQFKIVSLNSGIQVDGHIESNFDPLNNIISIKDLRIVTYRNILELQTNVISNASLFVGIHSGISYLAPLLGIKTINFYSDKNSGTYARNFSFFETNLSNFSKNSFLLMDISRYQLDNIIYEIRRALESHTSMNHN